MSVLIAHLLWEITIGSMAETECSEILRAVTVNFEVGKDSVLLMLPLL